MRTLDGYVSITMHEFKKKKFSKVLSEAALYCASIEKENPEFHIAHEYDDDGYHVLYVYEQY